MSEITAGTYELVAVQLDVPTSKLGEPFTYTRYRAGDHVQLDEAEARRLVLAGAVVEPGSRQRAAAAAAKAAYEAALAALPVELRAELGQVAETAPAAAAGTATEPAPEPGSVARPKQVEAKGKWVAYAIAQGVDPEKAAGMSKDELIAAFPRATGEPPETSETDGE